MTHGKSGLTELLSELRERINDTESLASIDALLSRLNREGKQSPVIGEEERQAFYTVSIFICSIVPICLLGTCLYLIKEKIKTAFGGLLHKKLWTRARDGFFSKTVIPTSKSRLIQKRSNEGYKLPLVHTNPEDNTRNNFESRSQPRGYVNQRIVSRIMNSEERRKKSDLASPQAGMTQSKAKSSSSETEYRPNDANRKNKGVQKDESVWTADMETTVPVGHHDPKKDGFITKPRAFWRRLFESLSRRKSPQLKGQKTLTYPAADDKVEDAASNLQMPTTKSQKARMVLEAAIESSSSSGSSQSTPKPAEGDKILQESAGFTLERDKETNALSPTKQKRWSSPNFIRNIISAFHNTKEQRSQSPEVRAAACGDGIISRQLYVAQSPQMAPARDRSHSPSYLQRHEDRFKLFERLKRNVIEELRLLQAVEEASAMPARSASDQVLAKSTQTRDTKFAVCENLNKQRNKVGYFPNTNLRQMFRIGNRQPRFEDAKSVASMGKIMSLKVHMQKMFDRFSYHKKKGPLLTGMDRDSLEMYKMELCRTKSQPNEYPLDNSLLSEREHMKRNLSPIRFRSYHGKENPLSFTPESNKGSNDVKVHEVLTQQSLAQESPAQNCSQFCQELKNVNVPGTLQKQKDNDALDNKIIKTSTLVNIATSPCGVKYVSHQTSPIRSVKGSAPPSNRTSRENLYSSKCIQTQNDLYPQQQALNVSKLCDRSQSPGEIICEIKKDLAKPKNLNKIPQISINHMEATIVEDDARLKKESESKEPSTEPTESLVEEKSLSLVRSERASSPPHVHLELLDFDKVDTVEHTMPKKTSLEKSYVKDNLINNILHLHQSLQKPIDERLLTTGSPMVEPKKPMPSNLNGQMNVPVQRCKPESQPRPPFYDSKVLRASYIPFQMMGTFQNKSGFQPNAHLVAHASQQGYNIPNMHPQNEYGDTMHIKGNARFHAPVGNGSVNVGQAIFQQVLEKDKNKESISNQTGMKQWGQQDSCLDKLKLQKESKENHGILFQAQRRTLHPASSGSLASGHAQALQTFDSRNPSQETMTFSDSMIETPRSVDDNFIIVHSFKNSKKNFMEKNDKVPVSSGKSYIQSLSGTRLETIKEDCLNNKEPTLINTSEADLRPVPIGSANVKTVFGDTAKYSVTQPFCPHDQLNTDVIEISDTMKSPSTPELTLSGQSENTAKFSSPDESHENNTISKQQLSSSFSTSTRQKLWPPKKAKQREGKDPPTKQHCKHNFEECQEIQELLPVPTLLEHSLKPTNSSLPHGNAEKARVSDFSSFLSVPHASSKEKSATHGFTLRDNEEFRSIQEPSSERYFDALEPDPLLWARLHRGERGSHMRQTRHKKDSSTISRVSSSGQPDSKSKLSEHNKISTNTLFKFASKSNKDKHNSLHKNKNNPDSKVVLRFACPLTDSQRSYEKERRRSSSCKRVTEEERGKSHVHHKRKNKSVDPYTAERQRNTSANHSDSKKNRQKHEVTDIKIEKTAQRLWKPSAQKREKPHKAMLEIKSTEKQDNQCNLRPLINSDFIEPRASSRIVLNPEEDKKTGKIICPQEKCPPLHNPNKNGSSLAQFQTENDTSFSQAPLCQETIIQRAQTLQPQTFRQKSYHPAPLKMGPVVPNQNIHELVQHLDFSNVGSSRHPGVHQRYLPHQSHPHVLRTGGLHTNDVGHIPNCQPNDNSFELSSFQNQTLSNCFNNPTQTPQGLLKIHKSMNQGHVTANSTPQATSNLTHKTVLISTPQAVPNFTQKPVSIATPQNVPNVYNQRLVRQCAAPATAVHGRSFNSSYSEQNVTL